MRKTVFSLMALLLCTMVATAQSRWSVTPHVGINISDVQGTDAPNYYKMAVGFTGGAEAEYRLSRLLGISAGAFYSVEGCKTNEIMAIKEGSYDIRTQVNRYEIRYLNFPVLLNFHVYKGLVLKGGLQIGDRMAGRMKGRTYGYYDKVPINIGDLQHGEEYTPEAYPVEPSSEGMQDPQYFDWKLNSGIKRTFNSIDFSVPLGVSYEYKHIALDIRYAIDLSNVSRNDKLRLHNSCTSITLGYRFGL